MMSPLLGVLGGMGPAATADFLAKLAAHTPATRDQDHIASIVYSDPATPDRSDAILADGEDPLPAMFRGIAFLDEAGCDLLAIPCNTAHHWYDDLAAATTVPVVHIVDAVVAQIEREAPDVTTIGLMATDGTVRSGIYQKVLSQSGRTAIDLTDLGPDNPVMAGIRAVKAGSLDGAHAILTNAIRELVARGAQGIVYGCTDVSAVLDIPPEGVEINAWDAADALAIACVKRLRG
ncbi:aspartate/glutamate racemase family protein [Actinobacteria bacterium YIM 96077]|uniref:Aspartate/glutamate racemase family protein n=1 Tax=Phytoactinopolyspora halophila TaxID=1981511 RepID=A0A329R5Y1_9ACTN|nr:amino acid racemase [Phytoactinopolyspora halophila]AYY11924.1 aspartate/glutamate racemase family protein [Actinobacteria bacterium YIM 96077]RAW18842.1 aspartate/glutamate racemase family protein [Phytoactinopolyspora halophila]